MRHTTLRQMQVFEAVSRHLSFSRAAQELNLTQPAVSLQIKQLEGLTRLPLFEQVGRKVYLTEAGETLLDHVRAVLNAVENADEAMAALRGEAAGKLRIGVISTAKYVAPTILSAFETGFPGIDLSLTVGNRQQILSLLADNAVDLAIMGRPPTSISVNAVPFAPHPMIFIANPSHPLIGKKITLSELDGQAFLLREKGSGTRTLMEELLNQNGVTPSKVFEMTSNETIKQGVMAGMGVSFISAHTVGLEVAVGRIEVMDVADTPVMREWFAVTREGKRLLPVAEAFIKFLVDRGEELIDKAIKGPPLRRRRRQ